VPRIPGENLFADVLLILDGPPARVVDVGCQHGDTSRNYLDSFPDCRLWSFEAEAANFARAQEMLAPYGERVHLYCKAVTDRTGDVALHVNSHNGTHSIFEIGEQRFWAGPCRELESRKISSIRLDDVFADFSDGPIDLLHLDMQGAELQALHGAGRLLRDRRIRLIYTEVEICRLYKGQPLFWELGQYLNSNGFRLYSLYDRYYHSNNPRALSWSDALFVCNELADVPEHVA
jgi:FkbM family methyltransferase